MKCLVLTGTGTLTTSAILPAAINSGAREGISYTGAGLSPDVSDLRVQNHPVVLSISDFCGGHGKGQVASRFLLHCVESVTTEAQTRGAR